MKKRVMVAAGILLVALGAGCRNDASTASGTGAGETGATTTGTSTATGGTSGSGAASTLGDNTQGGFTSSGVTNRNFDGSGARPPGPAGASPQRNEPSPKSTPSFNRTRTEDGAPGMTSGGPTRLKTGASNAATTGGRASGN